MAMVAALLLLLSLSILGHTAKVTVISDVDDTLRVTEIWNPMEAIINSFGRPFLPWGEDQYLQYANTVDVRFRGDPIGSLPALYRNMSIAAKAAGGEASFHYVTDAPAELAYENYVEGLRKHFPNGTYGFRSLYHSTNISALLSPRYYNIKKYIQEQHGSSKFVLVGDTATPGLLGSYIKLAKKFPQVQCIMIRDISATEPANWIMANMNGLPKRRHVFFKTPHQAHEKAVLLMQKLAANDSLETGCAGWKTPKHERPHDHGRLAGLVTMFKLVKQVYECWLVTLDRPRPHHRCRFDRKGIFKYRPVFGEGDG